MIAALLLMQAVPERLHEEMPLQVMHSLEVSCFHGDLYLKATQGHGGGVRRVQHLTYNGTSVAAEEIAKVEALLGRRTIEELGVFDCGTPARPRVRLFIRLTSDPVFYPGREDFFGVVYENGTIAFN